MLKFLGVTAFVKHGDHVMTWHHHGDSYSPWYDHDKIMKRSWHGCQGRNHDHAMVATAIIIT